MLKYYISYQSGGGKGKIDTSRIFQDSVWKLGLVTQTPSSLFCEAWWGSFYINQISMLLYCSYPKDLPQEIWTCISIYRLCMYIIHIYMYYIHCISKWVTHCSFGSEVNWSSRHLNAELLHGFLQGFWVATKQGYWFCRENKGIAGIAPNVQLLYPSNKNIKSIAVCVPNDIPLSIPSDNLT